jgi:hypothetical protein
VDKPRKVIAVSGVCLGQLRAHVISLNCCRNVVIRTEGTSFGTEEEQLQCHLSDNRANGLVIMFVLPWARLSPCDVTVVPSQALHVRSSDDSVLEWEGVRLCFNTNKVWFYVS